jgi:inosine-uridine nucleoside N-ribohydrolase
MRLLKKEINKTWKKVLLGIFVLLFLLPQANKVHSQPKIIFDTDFGGDADDLGALAMLHHFIDKKACEVLAIMSWSNEQFAVSAIDAVNRFYKHPQIPIGTSVGIKAPIDWNYNKSIADHFPFQLNQNNVPNTTTLYRKVLAENADSSITIVTVGPLSNIKKLLESKGDSLSILDGAALIKKKVKQFVVMGGQFPSGKKEWNFDGNMPGVTKYVIEHLEVPIVFSGYEVGVYVLAGDIFNRIEKNTPLYIGFMHFSQFAPWVSHRFEGKILQNPTYDQTAVLYAVQGGIGLYWDKIDGGKCVADEFGGNTWIPGAASKHAYLKLKMDKGLLANMIESYMLGHF